jgi:hypothetical protein
VRKFHLENEEEKMKKKNQNQVWKGKPNSPEEDTKNLPLPLGADFLGVDEKSTQPIRTVDRNPGKKEKNPSGDKKDNEPLLKKRGKSNPPRADVPHRSNPRSQFGQAGEKGIVMILALGFIAVFSIMATGFVTMGVRNTHLGSDYRYSSEALSYAEAGIQFAIGQMNADNIRPPDPILGDPGWENWVHTLETPGYGSEVTISYVKDMMIPHFDSATGEYPRVDKYFKFTSVGYGPQGTKRALEVITAQPPPEGFNFHYAWQLGGDGNLRNPVTYSGHSDSLPPVRMQANKPYFDSNEDGDFDNGIDRGWWSGPQNEQLREIEWDHPYPDTITFIPTVDHLHSAGKIHSNGDLIFGGDTKINGSVTARGDIWEYSEGNVFENTDPHYIRWGYATHMPKEPKINIPTNQGFWNAESQKDTMVHIITNANYTDYGFTISAGAYTWNDSDPIPEGKYHFDDDVKMAGNPTGNASIITDHTISLSGHPEDVSNDNLMAYIAGGDIRANGTGYVQGLLYTKGNLDIDADIGILGAVYVEGEGDIDKNPVVVFDTKLKDIHLLAKPVPPSIISWQEIIQ